MDPLTLFLGTILTKTVIQTGKKWAYESQLEGLKSELKKDLLSDFKSDEKKRAEMKLKQIELEEALIGNAELRKQVRIEREIINLMEDRLKQQQMELMKKSATQLDIANVLLTVQKTSNEMKEFITTKNRFNDEFIKTAKGDIKKEFAKEIAVQGLVLEKLHSLQEDTAEALEMESKKIDSALKSIADIKGRLDRQENSIEAHERDIKNQKVELSSMNDTFLKHKKALVMVYATTVIAFASMIWYLRG